MIGDESPSIKHDFYVHFSQVYKACDLIVITAIAIL